METDNETLLLHEVHPRLRTAIPKTIPMVGADDIEELVQDGIVIALLLYRSAKRTGKTITGSNVAHYAILALRSGRRSTGFRSSDVLHPAAQINGRARLQSMDEPIHETDGDHEMTLHDCLAAPIDDPATTAARRLDWEPVIQALDRTAKAILLALLEGRELTLLVPRLKRSRSSLQTDKVRLGHLIREHLGKDILVQLQARPTWRSGLDAFRERLACRAERRAA
jgi:hypothetical protein